MLVREMEHFSASKTRIVEQRRIEIETSAAPAVRDACCSIVAGVQHSIYLGLLLEKVCQIRCITQIASSEGRKKTHGLLLVLIEALLLLAVLHTRSIYMPSDNEFVACVDRKKSYGTPLLILHTWYDTTNERYSSCRYNERQLIDVTVVRRVRTRAERWCDFEGHRRWKRAGRTLLLQLIWSCICC